MPSKPPHLRVLPPASERAGWAETEARRLSQLDRPAEAVALALEHEQLDLAAELLAFGALSLVRNYGDHEAYFRMVGRLGPERLRRFPEMEAAAIWALALSNRLRLAQVRLDELEARIPELIAEGRSFIVENLRTPFDRNDPHTGMQCWVGMMRIILAAFSCEAEATLSMAEDWRRKFPRATEYDLGTVRCATGFTCLLLGRTLEAERDGLGALAAFRSSATEYGMAHAAACAIGAQLAEGRVAQAEVLLKEAAAHIAEGRERGPAAEVPLRSLHTVLMFQRGDLSGALERARAQMRYADQISNPLLVLNDLRVAAHALLALGRPLEALALFDQASFHGAPPAQAWWQGQMALGRACIAAVAGETSKRFYEGPPELREPLQLIAASRARPKPTLLRALRGWVQQAEAQRHADELAYGLFLKARVEHAIGQSLQARRTIRQLLTGVLTRDLVGTLAALAPGLQPLLCEVLRALLADRSATTESLEKLAALLGQTPSASSDAVVASQPPIELSRREQQIAATLVEGLSNREIAERLQLSEQTVKWHLWNLFQKLGVKNRMGAVRALR